LDWREEQRLDTGRDRGGAFEAAGVSMGGFGAARKAVSRLVRR
jgi:hypothetical protein